MRKSVAESADTTDPHRLLADLAMRMISLAATLSFSGEEDPDEYAHGQLVATYMALVSAAQFLSTALTPEERRAALDAAPEVCKLLRADYDSFTKKVGGCLS